MGGVESVENENVVSFRSSKIAKSLYPAIVSLHLDTNQLPVSGIILVGTEYVENYADKGLKVFSSYASSTRIVSSSMNYSEKYQTVVVVLGCQDNSIVLLGARFLTFLHKIVIHFHFSDIRIYIPEVEVTCEQQSFFQDFSIDCVTTAAESLFIGFNRGYVKEYSLKDLMVVRTYNPLGFIIEKEKLSNLTKTICIETTLIPGIDSIRYSNRHELIFVNHKRISSNLYHRVFTLDSTPIYVYDQYGEPEVRLEGFIGNILSAEVLENRTLYLCLSSEKNNIFIWNFKTGKLNGKIDCCQTANGPSLNIFYTKMVLHEFETKHRKLSIHEALDDKSPEKDSGTVEGDALFTISSSGEILVSLLKFEDEKAKLNWAPLKSMNIKYSEEEKLDKRKQIQMNIQSKSMTAILYDKLKDSLYFADQESNVTIIKNILKLSFKKT